jgi:hypothetical protein
MTTAPSTLRQSQDLLKASISDLIVLRDQWAGIDDLNAERAKVKAALDHETKYLAQTKGEVKEALYFRDKYLAEARDKLAESERLTKEITEKSVQVTQLNDYVNKMREKLG